MEDALALKKEFQDMLKINSIQIANLPPAIIVHVGPGVVAASFHGLAFSNVLRIIYQDEYIIAINKPSGLLSIPDGYTLDLPNLQSLLKKKSARYGLCTVLIRIPAVQFFCVQRICP